MCNMLKVGAVLFAIVATMVFAPAAHAGEGPNVEIWINNTQGGTDDLVKLGSSTPCQIHLENTWDKDMTVVLTSPKIDTANNQRLSFSAVNVSPDSNGNLTLNLPKDGSWVNFFIYGSIGSQAKGDATIEAHQNTAQGTRKGTATASVFYFRSPTMSVVQGGGTYSFVNLGGGSADLSTPGIAVYLRAQIYLEPPYLSCQAPQLRDVKIGILQNALAPCAYTAAYDTPVWDNPIVGDSVDVPPEYEWVNSQTSALDDVVAGESGPTYVGPVDVCDYFSSSNDTPGFGVSPYQIRVVSKNGTAGTVTYTNVASATIDADFLDWCVLYNSTLGATDPVAATQPQVESSWSLHVGTGKTNQQAVPQPSLDQSHAVTSSWVATNDPTQFANATFGNPVYNHYTPFGTPITLR